MLNPPWSISSHIWKDKFQPQQFGCGKENRYEYVRRFQESALMREKNPANPAVNGIFCSWWWQDNSQSLNYGIVWIQSQVELHKVFEREMCSENISGITHNNLVAPKSKAHQIQWEISRDGRILIGQEDYIEIPLFLK
jgi:hypothetical protein